MKLAKTKRVYIVLLAALMLLFNFILIGGETLDEKVEGNIFIQSESKQFKKGTLKNVNINDDIGDGAIVLSKGKNRYIKKGQFISNEISTKPFEYLVLSWNSDTPEGTSINIEARVLVKCLDKNGKWIKKWSDWLSWGKWGTYLQRASQSTNIEGALAYIDVDTLIVKGKSGETASKIQYRITLNSDNPDVTPAVRLVAGTFRNTLEGQGIEKIDKEKDIPDISNLNKVLDVPVFSQTIRDPEIAGSICSPTSMTMVLRYHGIDILPEESAWGVHDYDYGFGNWPFNVAFASSFGFKAYADYFNIESLKKEIYRGYPVIVSVRYKKNEDIEADLPVINAAPINKTYGHLIVVCGFQNEIVDGNQVEYVIVNDPAAACDEKVRLKYRLDQFEAAWNKSGKIAYIVHDKEKSAGYAKPERLQALLVAGNEKKDEYKLVYNNDTIDLSSKYINTIMVTKNGGASYEYIKPDKKATIVINSNENNESVNFLFIANDGKIFTANPGGK